MVIKYEHDPDDVWFVEAVGNGVIWRKWSTVRKYLGIDYTKIAIRRLNIERTPERLALVDQFCDEV